MFYKQKLVFYVRYLQYGSLPLFDELGKFPANFEMNRSELYNKTLIANGLVQILQLDYPSPGLWYGVSYHEFRQSQTVSKVSVIKVIIYMDV